MDKQMILLQLYDYTRIYLLILRQLQTEYMKGEDNKQFFEKALQNESFHKRMKQISSKFQQLQQVAHYSEPKSFAKGMIISLKQDDDKWWQNDYNSRDNIEIILGIMQPTGDKCLQKILLNISIHIPRPTKPYSIIYINTLADNNDYNHFKKSFEFLPLSYYVQLQKIYVLHASFKSKAFEFIAFDYMAQYIKNKIIHIDSFQQLAERLGIKCQLVIKLLPKEIIAKIDIIGENSKKETVHQLTFQHNINKKDANKPQSKRLQDYEGGRTGAPLVIELLLYFFDQNEKYLSAQGLFRKSADIEEETHILKELDNQNYDILKTIKDPHLISNAIKRFLSNLKQPIIPFRVFEEIMTADPTNLKQNLIKLVGQLSDNRIMTLLLLFEFFKTKLFPRQNDNKMNQDNMSVVIGPCLMRSQIASIKDLIYAQKIVSAVQMMFKDFDSIFGSKIERNQLIRVSVKNQQNSCLKENLGILKQHQIEMYSQEQKIEPINQICFKKHDVNIQTAKRESVKAQIFEDQDDEIVQKAETSLTKQQKQNLEQADQFLEAFHKKDF